MRSRLSVLLMPLLVMTLAGSLAAQDSGPPKPEEETRPQKLLKTEELKKEWSRAKDSFYVATQSVLNKTRELMVIEAERTKIQQQIDQLNKEPSGFRRDHKVSALNVEKRALEDQQEYWTKVKNLRLAETEERNTRDAALEAGWKLIPKMFQLAEDILERTPRKEQGHKLLAEAAAILPEIARIQAHKVVKEPRPDLPTKPDQLPDDPRQLRNLMKVWKDEADHYWNELPPVQAQIKLLGPEEARLANLIEKGYDTGGRVQNMLGLVRARLEDLKSRRDHISGLAREHSEAAKLAGEKLARSNR